MPAPKLVCVVPVRNGVADLPGSLDAAAHGVHTVVALDDGSTDATRVVLDTHPLVELVLANPARASYEGWGDADNRNRLLTAAGALARDRVLLLDTIVSGGVYPSLSP